MESQRKTKKVLPSITTQTAQSKPRGSWEQTVPSLKEENPRVSGGLYVSASPGPR